MICKTLPWQFKGGIQTHTWQLAQELKSLGHNVSLLTSGSFRNPESSYFKEGIQIIQIPYIPGRRLKLFSIAAEELAFNWSVKEWVKDNHQTFDIVHTQGRSGYLLYMIPGVYKKLLNTVHGLIDIESKNFSFWNINKRTHAMMAKFFERRLLKKTSRIITVSDTLKKDLKRLRSSNAISQVIPNGIPVKDEPLMIGRKPSRFLFIGRLHPMKGIKELVSQMENASPEIKLDIVGGGELKPAIVKLIEKKGLKDRVRLLGEKSSAEIEMLIPRYKALVVPSFYETQGIVILEANVKAVPVIASDIPAIRESVTHGENGLLCDPKNPQEFIDAMEFMAKEDLEAQCMGIRGRKMVQATYDWKILAKTVEHLYFKMAS